MPNNEVAVPAPGTVATPQSRQEMFVQAIGDRIVQTGKYAGASGFLGQALSAESLAEATATEDLLAADQHLGERFTFQGCVFADSELDGQLPFFAIIDVVQHDTGAVTKMACGGTRVVATLLRATEMGWFPFDASIESVPLGNGKSALNLVLAPAKVTNTA